MLTDLPALVAEDVGQWLSQRRSAGLSHCFGESALTLAVAESFVKRGVEYRPEAHSQRLFGLGKAGDINYDFVTQPGKPDQAIWELKYLKKSGDQRLLRDLLKLCLAAAHSRCRRYLLVVLEASVRSRLLDGGKFEVAKVKTAIQITCNALPVIVHGEVLAWLEKRNEVVGALLPFRFEVVCEQLFQQPNETISVLSVRRP